MRYVCPCCQRLLMCVGLIKRRGDQGDTIDLHFECMTCSHMLSMTVNVPNGSFIPNEQMWNHVRGVIPQQRAVIEVDNRDERCTWLWLSQTEYVDVDPVELHANMLENCCCEREV